jgi:hypothetical protein
MKQSPREANRFSASQEISRILWNPKVHYRVYKSLPPPSVMSQLDPVHVPTSHFLKIHLNIILQPMPGSSKSYLCVRFPHQNPTCTSPLPIRATCPANLILEFNFRIILVCVKACSLFSWSRRIQWAMHMARTGEKKIVCRVLVGKRDITRPFGRPRH